MSITTRQALRFAAFAVLAISAGTVYSQTVAPTNSPPNPYRSVENWAKMPQGRTWGSTAESAIDNDGSSVWVAERCGANTCAGSNLDPVLKFDASGNLVKSFGAGMFVFPHGIFVDRDGNVWVTDAQGKDGKGHQVFKFSPEGKVLLALGKPGTAGDGPDTFNAPSSVLVAPNGDIFVGDGHGGNTNSRIVKFSKDGKFIKTWGKKGSRARRVRHAARAGDGPARTPVRRRPQQQPHPDLRSGRQISSTSGRSSADRAASISTRTTSSTSPISESESVSKNHDGWKRGIRVGKASDGSVTAFIPDPAEKATGTSAAEGVAADAMGNIFGAEVGPKRLMRYVGK